MSEEIRQPSRFRELSLMQRGTTLLTLGLAIIAAACGNDPTGGEPPTPPSETTLITLPPTTTLTTIPEATTSTTEAPSTTTAETTTTTEAIDVSKAVDNNFYDGLPVIYLGNLRRNDLNDYMGFNDVYVRGSGSLRTVINEDYQGRQVEELVMDLVVDKNADGSAITRSFFVSAPEENQSIIIARLLTNDISRGLYDDIPLSDPRFLKILEEYVGSNKEFFMEVPYRMKLEASTQSGRDYVNEIRELLLVNQNIIADLELLDTIRSSSDPALYNNLHSYSEAEIGFPNAIYLPPPEGGWEAWDKANS